MEKKTEPTGMTRREALKVSGLGLAAGGLALGGTKIADAAKKIGQEQVCPDTNGCDYPVPEDTTQEYTYPTDYKLPRLFSGRSARTRRG